MITIERRRKMKNKIFGGMKFVVLVLCLLATLATEVYAAKQAPSRSLDINQASAEQLMTIPGLGATKAAAIVAYRQTKPFASTEELVEVKGIGEKLYAKVAPFVTVSGKSAQPGTAGNAVR